MDQLIANTKRQPGDLLSDDYSSSPSSSIIVLLHEEQRAREVEQHSSFSPLKQAGSYPLSSRLAAPRRPSRSGSFERQYPDSIRSYLSAKAEHEESGSEYDHQKFRRLLLGNNYASSDEESGHSRGVDLDSFPLPPLRYQKSASSAPPQIPNRVGSDSEDANNTSNVLPVTACNRQRSLPLAAFRPRPLRRRRRSRIQDRLDSENGSSHTPPKLPSRTGSDWSGTSQGVVPGVLVMCPSTPGSKSSATDAPKRPRRSLSPLCSSTIQSLFNSADQKELEDDDQEVETEPISNIVVDILPAEDVSKTTLPLTITKMTNTAAKTTIRKIRKLPGRAKTFSSHSKTAKEKELSTNATLFDSGSLLVGGDNCISLLMAFSGDDQKDVALASVADRNASMASLFSSTTWPKPRKTRVAPGRSRTFTFHQKTTMTRF